MGETTWRFQEASMRSPVRKVCIGKRKAKRRGGKDSEKVENGFFRIQPLPKHSFWLASRRSSIVLQSFSAFPNGVFC